MVNNKKTHKVKTKQAIQTTPTTPLSTNVQQSSGLETGPVLPLIPKEILQQLNIKVNETLKHAELLKKKNEKSSEEFKILEGIASEYLKSFLILGYTLNDNKILIGHAPTPKDHDALVEHLRQTFMRTVNDM